MKTCAVAIQKDEPNIVEWCKWHLDVCGFDKVFLFNDGCGPYDLPFGDKVVQAPAVQEQGQLGAQFRTYNAWLSSEEAREYDGAMFLDLDEYLVLHGRTPQDELAREWPVLGYNWGMFGSALSEGPADSMVLRFRRRGRNPNHHLKIMLNLGMLRNYVRLKWWFCNPHCLFVQDHLGHAAIFPAQCALGNRAEGPYNEMDCFDLKVHPYVAHYYAKTEDEFRRKIARGRCDALRNSQFQYWQERQEKEMWKTRADFDQTEVLDEELAQTLYGIGA